MTRFPPRPLGSALLLASVLVAAAGPVRAADDTIGTTALAVREVVRVEKAATAPIATGDAIFRNETVRTGADGAARFVFSDATDLALGPSSTVVLDRFVFDDADHYGKAVIGLAKGTFRFTTGKSPKDAYDIRTGTATIGLRGTVLDVRASRGTTTVTLVEGGAHVCAIAARRSCADLKNPGDTVTVTASGARMGGKPVVFAGAAGGGPAAPLGANGGFPEGALCGR